MELNWANPTVDGKQRRDCNVPCNASDAHGLLEEADAFTTRPDSGGTDCREKGVQHKLLS